MKSILLYANQDSGLEGRLQAALDLTRLFNGHMTCLQVTPYDAFLMGDPFGGAYALPGIVAKIAEEEAKHQSAVDEKLRGEDVSWDWKNGRGSAAQVIVDQSRLSDLVVLSLPASDGLLPITADVVIHARSPVLVVPPAARGFDAGGPALVAWNGSHEAAHALRFALPLLAKASRVHIVTVTEKDDNDFPAIDASEYLARHGVGSELEEWSRDEGSIAEALVAASKELGVAYIVMGAYGHSRVREAVVGGVTRDLLQDSPVPLLLSH